MNREEENWKDIKGYEGLYQVSDKGRIKTLANDKYRKEKIRKLRKDKYGYYQLNLTQNKETKTAKVHRLVAEAFIPNPDNLPEVNHKDENPANNNVENLEWCNHRYNVNYGTANQRRARKRTKTVYQYSPDGKLIKIWKSAKEAQQHYGKSNKINISSCCRGVIKQAYGFIWSYRISSQFP